MTHLETLSEFLIELELLGPMAQRAAIKSEVLQTGGVWINPPRDGCTSHLFEISLYGVIGRGADHAEAVSDWMRAANCMARHIRQEGGLTVATVASSDARSIGARAHA